MCYKKGDYRGVVENVIPWNTASNRALAPRFFRSDRANILLVLQIRYFGALFEWLK